MGIGAVTIGIAVVAVLVWLAVLVNSGRARQRRRRAEEVPANLQPGMTDAEMESRRLDKVLLFALISAAVLAVVVPIYYLDEENRQAQAVENLHEADVEEGEHWFDHFGCIGCHGVGGVGGGAPFVEARSGLETTWAAPSLNDVFYRFDENEVRYWITFGRAGTPMPALGLEGGGAMTKQEIDQVIAYLESIQIPQQEAFAQAEAKVRTALDRIERGDDTVAAAIEDQRVTVELIQSAGTVLGVVGDVDDQVTALLAGPGSCTDRTAELVGQPCDDPGADSDRDGVSDVAEIRLVELLGPTADILEGFLLANNLSRDRIAIQLDRTNPFTMSTAEGEPRSDLATVRSMNTALNTVLINLRATVENQEKFLGGATSGLAFLEESAAARRWAIDYDALAADAFDGDVEAARRAAGLYNAYCARCHTGGYSAGVAYEQEPGAGGFGPSLRNGRSLVQFPDPADHLEFLVVGSENAKPYGINGAGRGWMPGFGFVLSEADLDLIVKFERAL